MTMSPTATPAKTNFRVKEQDPEKRRARDLRILRLAYDQHKSAVEIAETVGVSSVRVTQILSENSRRDLLLLYLLNHADAAGRVDKSTNDMASEIKVDVNAIHYNLDNLRKKGMVSFKVGNSHGNDRRSLVDIRINRSAREWAKYEGHEKLDKSKLPTTHSDVFHPEEVEVGVVAHAEASPEPERETTPADDQVAPTVQERYEEAPHPHLEVHEIPRFRLINQLLERDTKLTDAAKLIESAGPQYESLAIQVLNATDDFSPLEREVIAYVRTKQEGDDASS